MKAINRIKELSGNILMLQHQLKSLELLDDREINLIIVDCLVESEEGDTFPEPSEEESKRSK